MSSQPLWIYLLLVQCLFYISNAEGNIYFLLLKLLMLCVVTGGRIKRTNYMKFIAQVRKLIIQQPCAAFILFDEYYELCLRGSAWGFVF
jgi:hypothetical protein